MSEPAKAIDKMRTALELSDLAVQVMRQNLRRRNPGASEAQVAAMLRQWMQTRPGAEHGDTVGRPIDWPRR